MTWLALIMAVAAAGFGLARWLRLPVIPLLLFAGMLLSILHAVPQEALTYNVVELGLSFLVFAAGMELTPARFARQRKAVLMVGLMQFAVVGLVGYGAACLLGFKGTSALYLGVAVSTSSTLVVVNHLKTRHQLFEPFGRLVIGVLLIQDLLMILLIVLLANLPGGALAVFKGLAGVSVVAGLALAGQRWVFPYLIIRLKPDEETLLLMVLALLFAMLGLAFHLGLPPVTGAFLAGFALAKFPVNGVVRGLLNSLSDFFQAVFFTALGAVVSTPEGPLVIRALLLACIVVVITPPLVTLIAEYAGFNSRAAVESGLLLAQTSEFALVLGLTGHEVLGQISSDVLSVIAIVTVLTMTLTPFLGTDRVTRRLLQWHPLRRRMSEEGALRDHVVMLGFGAGGMWVHKPLVQHGYEVLVVDDDPVVIEQLQKAHVHCLRGDGSDTKVLNRAGARQARFILAGMRRVGDAEKVIAHVGKVPVFARVFEQDEADRIDKLGGIPILNAEAAADTFMEWFDKTQQARQSAIRSD